MYREIAVVDFVQQDLHGFAAEVDAKMSVVDMLQTDAGAPTKLGLGERERVAKRKPKKLGAVEVVVSGPFFAQVRATDKRGAVALSNARRSSCD